MTASETDCQSQAQPTVATLGECRLGQSVRFREFDLHRDLLHMNFVGLYAYGITGRMPTLEETAVLQLLWVATSYPEPRIWNNRIAALAGSVRSTASLSIGAATAVTEAAIYGQGPKMAVYDFLTEVRSRMLAGEELAAIVQEALKAKRRIKGYGRPVGQDVDDERIAPVMAILRKYGRADLPYVRLVPLIEHELRKTYPRLRTTYAALGVAVLLDMGFSRWETNVFAVLQVSGGMAPCYVQGFNSPEGSTFNLTLANIEYGGPAPRTWVDLQQRTAPQGVSRND